MVLEVEGISGHNTRDCTRYGKLRLQPPPNASLTLTGTPPRSPGDIRPPDKSSVKRDFSLRVFTHRLFSDSKDAKYDSSEKVPKNFQEHHA
jgi:hypothetical protein